MVRIKHRYLLVNILYPELGKQPKSKVPDIVAFHQATTNSLTHSTLLKGVRAEVANLFGDYGSGAISDSLNSEFPLQFLQVKAFPFDDWLTFFSVKYLSNATSTFILRVARDHYRMVWAALSMMNSIPVKDGRNCVFRVVRVSGTIRKAEQEAIRRAREIILMARRETESQSDLTLDNILGKDSNRPDEEPTNDLIMVDRSDSDEDEEDIDDAG